MADQLPPIPIYRDNQVGALILFKESVTKEQAAKALRALAKITTKITVHTFDNRYEVPGWYIP